MSTIGYIDTDDFDIILTTVFGIGYDTTVITKALTNAYKIILSALLSRGITDDEINLWTRKEEYQSDIAVYLYAKYLGKLTGDDKSKYDPYNRIKELETVSIVTTDEYGVHTVVSNGSFEPQILDLKQINYDLFLEQIENETES